MDSTCGFVSHVGVAFRRSQFSRVCGRHQPVHGCRQRRSRVIAMGFECVNDERNSLKGSGLGDGAEVLEPPEIMDVDMTDDASENEVLSALTTEVEVYGEKRKKMRDRTQALIDEINVQPDTIFASDADGQPPIEEDETTVFVRAAVRACDERKGEDIMAIRVSKLTYITSFVVLATGNNPPQIRAMANLVEEDLAKKHATLVRRTDGTANSGWMLLDYGDFMVNIFNPEQRKKYKLEVLWKEGEVLNISDCLTAREEKAKEEEPVSSLDDWLSDEKVGA